MLRVLTKEEVEALHRIMNPELARIEQEAIQRQEQKAYDYITHNLIDACDNYIENNYKFENISERFGKSLEDFKEDIKSKMIERDVYEDEHGICTCEEIYEEDEDEEMYW